MCQISASAGMKAAALTCTEASKLRLPEICVQGTVALWGLPVPVTSGALPARQKEKALPLWPGLGPGASFSPPFLCILRTEPLRGPPLRRGADPTLTSLDHRWRQAKAPG